MDSLRVKVVIIHDTSNPAGEIGTRWSVHAPRSQGEVRAIALGDTFAHSAPTYGVICGAPPAPENEWSLGLGAWGQVMPGLVSTLDFTPTQTGQFAMTCPMGMFDPGTVIVTQ